MACLRDHPLENILGYIKKGVSAKSKVSNFCDFSAFISQVECKSIEVAIINELDYCSVRQTQWI